MASERVELARPFAVVDGKGGLRWWDGPGGESGARDRLSGLDREFPGLAPHIVVRLTAERVEEPIPPAVSGWEWRVRVGQYGKRLERKDGEGWFTLCYFPTADDWRRCVPPCDHAHVEALLKREGVPNA